MAKKRNYKRATEYESSPEQIHRRVLRNKARRLAIRKGLARKGDGKDVHHRDGKKLSIKSIRVISRSKNRSFRRNRNNKNLGLRKGKK